ncbi:hypothetical protein ACFWIW_36290 [Amycolatopsis sp. NPDC058340]|uniref:hypothetical protein n=1 Tax=Amycolatopsis sp. NPDC058340 TaxID=3346453 RepID=UPI00365C288E
MPRGAEEENARPVTVPTAVSQFPADPWPTARRWAERRYRNLYRWTELGRGGHFPGLEYAGAAGVRDPGSVPGPPVNG